MENKDNITGMIEELKNSPLYAMSLGGRELYHSNFWAWLMEQDSKFINVFFDGEFDGAALSREEKHHDLTIHKDGRIYIIENKIKSLATKEQLDRYLFDMFKSYIDHYKNIHNKKYTELNGNNSEKLQETASILKSLSEYLINHTEHMSEVRNMLNKKSKKIAQYVIDEIQKANPDKDYIKKSLLLTGLLNSPPKFIDDNGWKYVSYRIIIGNIRKILEASKIKHTENEEIVTKYCNDVENLSNIINKLLLKSGESYTFDEAEQLKGIRFDDTYKKLKMEHFANTVDLDEISRRIEKSAKDDFKLKKEVDFSNKKSILTIKYEKSKKSGRKDKKYAIGIQIEEYAFRYFVEAPDLATKTFGKNSDKKDFKALVDADWFVNKNTSESFHKETLASQGDPCNKYEPDFIYQHYNCAKGTTYTDLRDKIYEAFSSDIFSKPLGIVGEMK